MIGIFFLWRELARNNFWLHLLFGMVTTTLGQAAYVHNTQHMASNSSVSNLFASNVLHFNQKIHLQKGVSQSNLNIGYSNQHVIRTIT